MFYIGNEAFLALTDVDSVRLNAVKWASVRWDEEVVNIWYDKTYITVDFSEILEEAIRNLFPRAHENIWERIVGFRPKQMPELPFVLELVDNIHEVLAQLEVDQIVPDVFPAVERRKARPFGFLRRG